MIPNLVPLSLSPNNHINHAVQIVPYTPSLTFILRQQITPYGVLPTVLRSPPIFPYSINIHLSSSLKDW